MTNYERNMAWRRRPMRQAALEIGAWAVGIVLLLTSFMWWAMS